MRPRTALALAIIAVTATVSTFAVAGPASDVTNVRTGVWNGGMAAPWDWEAIDLFAWNPRGFRPTQPIQYSHRMHIENAQMECQYCHYGVAKSPAANIPSVEACMACHNTVRTDRPEIQKLKAFYEKKEPIPWVRVNFLPELSKFNHERHVKAGVGCQTCHGLVQKMEVVEKASSFKMGFCVSCHREYGASTDCSICHY